MNFFYGKSILCRMQNIFFLRNNEKELYFEQWYKNFETFLSVFAEYVIIANVITMLKHVYVCFMMRKIYVSISAFSWGKMYIECK